MRRKLILIFISIWLSSFVTSAQDALNLPTELYILLNGGQVERYGLGADGVQTITPEGEFIIDFGVASDDNWLAYRTQNGMYISNIYEPDTVQLMDESADVPPIRGNGDTLAWSSGDSALAYVTLNGVRVFFRDGSTTDIAVNQVQHLEWSPDGSFLLAETAENIWWVYRRVGLNMPLSSVIPSSQGITWLNDSVLIFAPADGGLLTMDLNDNNAQTTIMATSQVYNLPYYVGEGVYRVLVQGEDTSFGRLMLLQVDDNGGVVTEEIGEGDVELSSIRWAPGGNLLIAFQGGVMALVDPISGQGFTLPITSAVSYDWGQVQSNVVDNIVTDKEIYFLGEDVMGVRQVWTFADDGNPFSITPATGDITAYDITDNGQQIVYISQDQLWLYNRADDELTSLVESGEPMQSPRFSLDGKRIVYSVDTVDNSKNGGIWLMSIDEDENTLILANGATGSDVVSPPFYSEPQWASNINALLVKASGSETTSLSILDANTLEVVPLGQYEDGFWLSDGRVVAWGTGLGIGTPQISEIVILDPNAQQDPIPLFTLPADILVENLVQVGSNELQLITRQNTFGPSSLLVVNVPINGTPERLFVMPPLIDPVFSANGDFIASLTRPNGNFVWYDSETREQVILTFPTGIGEIIWQ
jgi:dipeptidyl aminopeptidase/acylaminoacyl peptidase